MLGGKKMNLFIKKQDWKSVWSQKGFFFFFSNQSPSRGVYHESTIFEVSAINWQIGVLLVNGLTGIFAAFNTVGFGWTGHYLLLVTLSNWKLPYVFINPLDFL